MPTFDVAAGHLQGRYDGVLLSTDLEPDDALAIKALAPRAYRKCHALTEGEGPAFRYMGTDERSVQHFLPKYLGPLQGPLDLQNPYEVLSLLLLLLLLIIMLVLLLPPSHAAAAVPFVVMAIR